MTRRCLFHASTSLLLFLLLLSCLPRKQCLSTWLKDELVVVSVAEERSAFFGRTADDLDPPVVTLSFPQDDLIPSSLLVLRHLPEKDEKPLLRLQAVNGVDFWYGLPPDAHPEALNKSLRLHLTFLELGERQKMQISQISERADKSGFLLFFQGSFYRPSGLQLLKRIFRGFRNVFFWTLQFSMLHVWPKLQPLLWTLLWASRYLLLAFSLFLFCYGLFFDLYALACHIWHMFLSSILVLLMTTVFSFLYIYMDTMRGLVYDWIWHGLVARVPLLSSLVHSVSP